MYKYKWYTEIRTQSIKQTLYYKNNVLASKQYTSTEVIYKYSNNIQVLKQYTSIQTIYKYSQTQSTKS